MHPGIIFSFFSSVMFVWNNSSIILHSTTACLSPCSICAVRCTYMCCLYWLLLPRFSQYLCKNCSAQLWRGIGISRMAAPHCLHSAPGTVWNITIISVYKSPHSGPSAEIRPFGLVFIANQAERNRIQKTKYLLGLFHSVCTTVKSCALDQLQAR